MYQIYDIDSPPEIFQKEMKNRKCGLFLDDILIHSISLVTRIGN